MSNRSMVQLTVLSIFFVSAEAAEIGDVNGDGRVSFADSYLLRQWIETSLETFRPASGSDRVEDFVRCTPESDYPELVYIESLRRASSSPLPHPFEVWPETNVDESEPPEPDPGVRIEIVPAVLASGEDADFDLRLRLTTAVPLDALGLVLRAEGVTLRMKDLVHDRIIAGRGDLKTRMATQYYLVSGGSVAFHTDISAGSRPAGIEPGTAEMTLPVNLPRGTPPGTYTVRLLPGTEAVTRFGEVIVPELVSGMIEITEAITLGDELPFPPLDFDIDQRRINGKAEIRITEAAGLPGETVSVRVQVRTERPINFVGFTVAFDHRSLFMEEATPLYADPRVSEVVGEDFHTTIMNNPPLSDLGGLLNFRYAPRLRDRGSPSSNTSRDHSYTYLSPLGEWIDLLDLRFTIQSGVSGGPSRLTIVDRPGFAPAYDEFLPYRSGKEFGKNISTCDDRDGFWRYDPTEYIDGAVNVLGVPEELPDEDPPLDPLEAEIRFFIGDVSDDEDDSPARVEARRGEVVELPVYLTTGVGLHEVRMVFGFDPSQLELVGFEVNFRDFDGVPFAPLLEPVPDQSSFVANMECEFDPDLGHGECLIGEFPFFALLHTDPPDVSPPASLLRRR